MKHNLHDFLLGKIIFFFSLFFSQDFKKKPTDKLQKTKFGKKSQMLPKSLQINKINVGFLKILSIALAKECSCPSVFNKKLDILKKKQLLFFQNKIL